MKSILLASTAIVAFSGAAYAEAHSSVTWSGDATLGWNDEAESGFYWSAGLGIAGSVMLDNGLTAGFSTGCELLDGGMNGLGSTGDIDCDGYELYLTADNAGLYFGITDVAADKYWEGVDGMTADAFHDSEEYTSSAGVDAILRGEVVFGNVEAAISYGIIDGSDELFGLQAAAVADLGNFTVGMAYQADDVPNGQVFGVFGSTTLGGADLSLAYAQSSASDGTSIGVGIAYPFGPVTVSAYYASNDPADDAYGFGVDYADGPFSISLAWDDDGTDQTYEVDASYDVGNGIMILAGLENDGTDDFFYVGGEMDLGGGATFLVSYNEGDETGGPEYMEGTTVEVSFEF